MIQPLTQPVPSAPLSWAQTGWGASGASLRHMVTPPPRRIDSLRAKRMSARKALTLLDIVVDSSTWRSDGAAMVARMATMANTTINSSRVNP